MSKFQELIDDNYSKRLGFACRAILFLEDVLEDAECEEVFASGVFGSGLLRVYGIKCRYDLKESIEVFSEEHDLHAVVEKDINAYSLSSLYHIVIEKYLETLHKKIQHYAFITNETGVEYFLGVLLNGKGFLVEGEENRVVLPSIPMCISAHTHPGMYPYPSRVDLKTIERILLERGLGHAIVTYAKSLVLYRVAPVSERDYLILKEVQSYTDTMEAVKVLTHNSCIRMRLV